MITAEYEPTERELQRVYELNRSYNVFEWITAIVALVVGVIGVAVGLALFGVPLIILGLALAWFLAFGIARKAAKARVRAAVATTVTIDENTITVVTPTRTREVPWSTVRRVRENPYGWSVYAKPVGAGIILKRTMTDQQRSEFTLLIATNVAGNRVTFRDEPKPKRKPTPLK
jgi:hypothetical protein